jgi:hypothetical protein
MRKQVLLSSGLIDFGTLEQEEDFLRQHVVIVNFVDGAEADLNHWTTAIQLAAAPGHMVHYREAGNGFYYIKTDGLATT